MALLYNAEFIYFTLMMTYTCLQIKKKKHKYTALMMEKGNMPLVKDGARELVLYCKPV